MSTNQPWAGALKLLEIAAACPAGIRPFIVVDPSQYGPDSNHYWLVKHVSIMCSNTNGFSFGLYLCVQNFQFQQFSSMAVGNGLATVNNAGTFPTGVIKIAPHTGSAGSGDETSLTGANGDQLSAIY